MTAGYSITELLPELGFRPPAARCLHDWELRSGPLELKISEGINRYFAPALNFSGMFNSGRILQSIEFSLGLTTASREQALALIGYNLRGLPLDVVPAWVAEGIALQGHLPWRKARP